MKNSILTQLTLTAAFVLCAALAGEALAAEMPETGATTTGVVKESPETRIKSLHDELGITANEEAKWSPVAQAMLTNANAINDAVKDRMKMSKTMTAVDDLKSYQAIVDAHADGIKKLAATFAPLYAAMPAPQQKHADAVFGRRTEPTALKSHA